VNEFGVQLEPDGYSARGPIAQEMCAFFNAFWTLMNVAVAQDRASLAAKGLSTDLGQFFAGNYRLFFTRFCSVMRQGPISRDPNTVAAWKGLLAYSKNILSTYLVHHRHYNEELLAREMWARYIVGPLRSKGKRCTVTTQTDLSATFRTFMTDQDMKVVEYREVGSVAGAPVLCALGPNNIIRQASFVWMGRAAGPCRAVPFLFFARGCATNAAVKWQDKWGDHILPDGVTNDPIVPPDELFKSPWQ
jgi:hypothetical protein